MTDLGAISIGIQSIKTALDITKELKGIDASLKDAEVKLKFAELMEALSEAKIQLIEVRDENHALKERIKLLEKKLNQKGEVEYRDGYYYMKESKAGEPDGPFCSKCYNDEEKLILLNKLKGSFTSLGKYNCPKCEGVFN